MALDLLRGSAERGNALRAGVILIGGSSTRMGTDKSALVLGGQTLLDRTITALSSLVGEILIVGKAGVAPVPEAPKPPSPSPSPALSPLPSYLPGGLSSTLAANSGSSSGSTLGSTLGLKPGVDLGALLGGGSLVAEGIAAASEVFGPGANKGFERTAPSVSLTIRRVPDRWPGEGPLGGILTAFASTTAMEILVVAVDLPWLSVSSLRDLCGAPMLMPPKKEENEKRQSRKSNPGKGRNREGDSQRGDADCLMTLHQGRLQPLHARYTRRCQALLEPQFKAGERSILRCELDIGEHLAADHDRSSQDVDTPEQWKLAQEGS